MEAPQSGPTSGRSDPTREGAQRDAVIAREERLGLLHGLEEAHEPDAVTLPRAAALGSSGPDRRQRVGVEVDYAPGDVQHVFGSDGARSSPDYS